jgi:HTH-type transcriptional regulator / antitoxin HigA
MSNNITRSIASGRLRQRASSSEVLQHIIESSGIDRTELVNIFGSSELVAQVLAGTKSIDPIWAQALGRRFKLSPKIFLQS